MKKGLQLLGLMLTCFTSFAQVTKINSNNSLEFEGSLGNNKGIYVSDIDKSIWVSDATTGGTFQLSSTVKFEETGAVLNNKLVFSGTTTATGTELWITDGTVAGTHLVKDIMPGTDSSAPDDDFALLNGYLYFSAESPGIGRELWRTDGTEEGTTLVKDIITGPAQSALAGNYDIFSTGTYLLLTIPTAVEGEELWRSDGTADGTFLLKDINPNGSSEPAYFYKFNNMVLFIAKDAAHGKELWKTDGTADGTQLVKDIRPNAADAFGFFFLSFYQFNGKAYFLANNGTTGDEIWSTDGTTENTRLVKDIQPGTEGSFALLFTAVNMGNKFIFTAFNQDYDYELWESDGTDEGTKLFKEVAQGDESGMPFIYTPIDYNTGNQQLFQGNKFFFTMILPDVGTELWISDGTPQGTGRVKNINPNNDSSFSNLAFAYTASGLYFTVNDGMHGEELWKSDGTEAGTQRVTDINPGEADADISISYAIINNKLILQATDGDDPVATDLYTLDLGSTLPVKLLDFTVTNKANDALLQWSTAQELNSKDFTIERSFDGRSFSPIGSVKASGSSATKKEYNYTDKDIMNSGKDVVYYRLLMNDKDGKSVASKVISVKIKGNAGWDIKLINNPVTSSMVLSLTGITNGIKLSVKDVTGKTVYNAGMLNSNGQVTIPADRLTPGIYLLVAETNTERKAIRFVKQ